MSRFPSGVVSDDMRGVGGGGRASGSVSLSHTVLVLRTVVVTPGIKHDHNVGDGCSQYTTFTVLLYQSSIRENM